MDIARKIDNSGRQLLNTKLIYQTFIIALMSKLWVNLCGI